MAQVFMEILRTRRGLGLAQGCRRPLDSERRLYWGGCTVEKLHWEALWLQAIQNSAENIMEKREEIADSG